MKNRKEISLENICDSIASQISDVDGSLSSAQIEVLISEALESTEYTREDFDEMFQTSYECDIVHYTKNAVDDASWAAENGLFESDNEILLDVDEFAEVDPDNLGIFVERKDDLY